MRKQYPRLRMSLFCDGSVSLGRCCVMAWHTKLEVHLSFRTHTDRNKTETFFLFFTCMSTGVNVLSTYKLNCVLCLMVCRCHLVSSTLKNFICHRSVCACCHIKLRRSDSHSLKIHGRVSRQKTVRIFTAGFEIATYLQKCFYYILGIETPLAYCTGRERITLSSRQYAVSSVCVATTLAPKSPKGRNFHALSLSLFFHVYFILFKLY